MDSSSCSGKTTAENDMVDSEGKVDTENNDSSLNDSKGPEESENKTSSTPCIPEIKVTECENGSSNTDIPKTDQVEPILEESVTETVNSKMLIDESEEMADRSETGDQVIPEDKLITREQEPTSEPVPKESCEKVSDQQNPTNDNLEKDRTSDSNILDCKVETKDGEPTTDAYKSNNIVSTEKEDYKANNVGESSQEGHDVSIESERGITMIDVLNEQEAFENDANAVLGPSDDKNCTYLEGYIKRQALYACMTCCPESRTDDTKRAGFCLACSLTCHENHELLELYTKRSFRCDCGNPKVPSQECQFISPKEDINTENIYNQNFSGLYCICHRPYPDPDAKIEDEMIQCIVCEDWLHSDHMEATIPNNDQYSEMICKGCMKNNEFLNDYCHLVVNLEDLIDLNINTNEKLKITTNDMKVPDVVNENDVEAKNMEVQNKSEELSNITSDKSAEKHVDSSEICETNVKESKTQQSLTNEQINNEKLPDISDNFIAEVQESNSDNKIEKNLTESQQCLENTEIDDSSRSDTAVLEKKRSETEIINENIEPPLQTNKDDLPLLNESIDSAIDSSIDESSHSISMDSSIKMDAQPCDEKVISNELTDSTDFNIQSNKSLTEPENLIDINSKANSNITNLPSDVEMVDPNNSKTSNRELNTTEPSAHVVTKLNDTCVNTTETNCDNSSNKRKIEDATDDEISKKIKICNDDNEGNLMNNDVLSADQVLLQTNGDASSEHDGKLCDTSETNMNESHLTTENVTHIVNVNDDIERPDGCIRPMKTRKIFKGATFWPCSWRQKLCSCFVCLDMYRTKSVLFLLDMEDTVSAYEDKGRLNNDDNCSQYEKGLKALSSLDRVQQINAITEYNKMKEKLLDFLKTFKDKRELVKEEDIRAFFAGMKPRREPDGVYFCR